MPNLMYIINCNCKAELGSSIKFESCPTNVNRLCQLKVQQLE